MECMKCQTAMLTANLVTAPHRVPLYLYRKKKGLFESEKTSAVTCYVCPHCGYIELNADDPKNLILT